MSKRYLYLSIFGIVLIIIAGIFILTVSSAPKKTPIAQPWPIKTSSGTQITTETATPTHRPTFSDLPTSTAVQLSSEDVAKSFYTWYFTYQSNPLLSAAYKQSPYLTDAFKNNITAMINPANPSADPVFCSKNKTAGFTVDQIRYETVDKAQIVIKSTADGKPIYRFILLKTNGKWLINDIICLP